MRWLAGLRRWFAGSAPAGTADTTISGRHTTRPADWADGEHLAALLERHRVEYVLIGGYALYANGLICNIGDIDFVVRDALDDNARWIAALSELQYGDAAELAGEAPPFPLDDEADGQAGAIRAFDAFVVDVMPQACGLSYDDLMRFIGHSEQVSHGVPVVDNAGHS